MNDKRPGKVTEGKYETIVKLLKEGKSNKEISIISKISITTAWKYRKMVIDEGKL